MFCKCGYSMLTTHTQVTKSGVKRSRFCTKCSNKIVTYERPSADTPNEYEQRLISKFRTLTKVQKEILWSLLRVMGQSK